MSDEKTLAEMVEEMNGDGSKRCDCGVSSYWDESCIGLLLERLTELNAEAKKQDEYLEFAIERSNWYLHGLNEAIEELKANKAENEELRKQIRRVHAYDHMQKVCGTPMPVRACNEDPCDICRQPLGGQE